MRKSAIIAIICLSFLTGCGKTDPVISESDSAETTVAVEKKTEEATSDNKSNINTETTTAKGTETTTANTKASTTTTISSIAVRSGGTTLTVPKRTGTVAKTTTKRTSATTVQTTTTTVAVTTTAISIPDNATFSKDNLECKVTENGIDIYKNDDIHQTIEIDTEDLLNALSDVRTQMKAQIIIDDIDLDGNDDLFIPQQVGTLNTFGVYYHYDTEENKYVLWEQLKEIDSRAEVNEVNMTFTTEVKLAEEEYEIKVFTWNNGEPAIQSMKKQYRSQDNKDELLVDYFEYTNGEEVLIKRERVLFDIDGREVGAEEIEIN